MKKLGYIQDKLAFQSIWNKLPAERTGMSKWYLINRSQTMFSSGSAIGRPHRFWMELSICTNDTLPVKNNYMIMFIKSLTIQQQLEPV